ncbi:MAG TPA: hypothetical protein VEG28_03420, partial [Dehalococcoidia bacterium]|nr:hypothetical protein [Dehalococcoidia bacterium]
MECDQCTPLITSDHSVDARGEVAEGPCWVTVGNGPKSCRCNLGSHINRVPRLGGVTGVNSSSVTLRLKIVGNNPSQYHWAMIPRIWVKEPERSDGNNTFCVVISLQDGYPKRIIERSAGTYT